MARGPQRVFLHVGVPKTGTTFLQSVLVSVREPLKNQGILYPGKGSARFLAAQDLTEHHFLGRENPRVAGAWPRLVKESRRWTDTVVISHELFTHALPQHMERAVADFDSAEFHVVMTVRDFERQLPAVWQERLKNGSKVSFLQHYDRAVEHSAERPGQSLGFWRQQDAVGILGRWATYVPRERIHVITVPQRGAPRDLLWNRLASVIGADPSVVDFEKVRSTGNVSLRPPQARLLRRINQHLRGRISHKTYRTVVKRYLSEVPQPSSRPDVSYGLTPEQLATARAWSLELARDLVSQGYSLVGDVDELHAPVSPVGSSVVPLDDVADEDEASAAVAAAIALIARDAAHSGREREGVGSRLRGLAARARGED